MGALCKLTWSGDRYYDDGWKDTPPVTLDTAMTEADFSNKHLGASGAIILAAVLRCKTFRGSGALSKLDISGNQICGLNKYGNGTYDTSGLAALAKSIGNLKELNISSNCLKAEGARILAPALQDSRSLSKLKMDTYELPVQEIKTATELDLSNKGLGKLDAIVIAVLIKVRKFQNRFVTN
jgi:hypothetical protein